ncbi:hypothetical protein BSL78_21797 [Apostichopus japonicus]|uniref:E3 ubiquitin-protein ligase TRIM56-like n=1 Tax=Stichopus japonicus TaxID=307972 RepID=A0A2G8K015_STIJA|nr:hypothetical protein BSL78_21797 [Apostichopus japonicus]
MASSTVLQDIEDKFLQCSICLDQLKEPKVLPCIHRYCKECLDSLLQRNNGIISCPDCREEHLVPNEGVDGFKTDFNIKNITEFIQLQDSLKNKPLQMCIGCAKKQVITTYCFKCNDFLCQGCHDYHMTSTMFKDHRPHVIGLGEIESRNLTIEKLALFKEVPKCHMHSEKLSELCCKTCHYVPICMACGIFGRHKGHDLYEVNALAESERAGLVNKLSTLTRYKDSIYEMKES